MLNESIIKIRVELQKLNIKQSGHNDYSGFKYYKLSDFLPQLNKLMLEEKVNDRFYIENDYAVLELIKDKEVNKYTIPFVMFNTPMTYKKDKNGNYLTNKTTGEYIQVPSMQDIQYLGALNTYYRRYLYLNAFGIDDGDSVNIDSIDNREIVKNEQLASKKQIELLEKYYQGDNLTKLLEQNNISELKDMPMKKASAIISELMKKGNK